MPDWKKIVREKVGSLPLKGGRQEEVIDELAQQLESAYEEAIAMGANESEATRRSLAQFSDWEKLRSEVFRSVEGTQLPIWEQNGVFSPRRLPVWIALALTLALLAAPAFRQALLIFPLPGTNPTAWSSRTFSERALRGIERSGDKKKYARALAFVALHSPDDLQAMHAAEKAIALDPQLTWISARISHATYLIPGYDPHPWIERLKSWDPQNAFPYLLEASANIHSDWETRWARYNAATSELREALAAEPAWRLPMEQAFAAPRVDLYAAQQFALDRQVLREQGLDRPDMLTLAVWSRELPDLIAITLYADIQLKDVGESAEKAGRTKEALATYWKVASFGGRFQTESSDIVRMYSVKYREEAYKRMISLLHRKGRLAEAAAIEAALSSLPTVVRKSPLFRETLEASAVRSARIVETAVFLLVVLGTATAVWLISVAPLRWKPAFSHGLNRLSSVLCFAPPLLFLSGLTLFVAYYPYAQPIGELASQEELLRGYAPFFMNLYDFVNLRIMSDVWLARMFWPSVWCAAVALAGAALLHWVARRERPDHTGEA